MHDIQRFVDIPAGKTLADAERRVLQFGTDPFRLRQVRVGLTEEANGVRYTARLTVPGGQIVGRIDIPFRFNIESPVSFDFSSDSENTVNQQIMLTMHDLPDSPNLYGATYFIADARTPESAFPSGYTKFFPWVQAVTIYNGATATFYDSNGNPICTATGPQLVARPRAAEYITTTSQQTNGLLFHY